MKFGLHLGNYGTGHTGERLIELARLADAQGYDSVWVSDHVVAPISIATGVPEGARGRTFTSDAAEVCYEAIVLLSVLASATGSVRLGTSVLVPAQRHAVVLAKQIATLDALSNGRVDLGVGGGWLAEEFAALGVPFADRWRRLEETLDIFRALWTRRESEHAGASYTFAPVRMAPKPAQVNGPRVTVGGRSTRALRIAGERGDGLNAARLTPGEVRVALDRVRGYAERAGRDTGRITLLMRCDLQVDASADLDPDQPWLLAGTPDTVAEQVALYRDAGTSEVIVTVKPGPAGEQDDRIRWLAETVMPQSR